MMQRAAQAVRCIFMWNRQAKYADSVNNYGAFLSTLRQYVAAQQPLSIQY
jgi:Tfp pilus assembly protein PilF